MEIWDSFHNENSFFLKTKNKKSIFDNQNLLLKIIFYLFSFIFICFFNDYLKK